MGSYRNEGEVTILQFSEEGGRNQDFNGVYHSSQGTEGLKNLVPEKSHPEWGKLEATLINMMMT